MVLFELHLGAALRRRFLENWQPNMARRYMLPVPQIQAQARQEDMENIKTYLRHRWRPISITVFFPDEASKKYKFLCQRCYHVTNDMRRGNGHCLEKRVSDKRLSDIAAAYLGTGFISQKVFAANKSLKKTRDS